MSADDPKTAQPNDPTPPPGASKENPNAAPKPGDTSTVAPTSGPASLKPTTIQPGEPGNEDGDEPRTVIGDPRAALTPIGDPTGTVTNTPLGRGTIQKEPTPEELPPDVKIAPFAEQVNPNNAAQAVGAQPTPDKIAGVDQPREGEKNVLTGEDRDHAALLPEHTDQGEDLDHAVEDAERDAKRGRV